jgi:hypothetical protein
MPRPRLLLPRKPTLPARSSERLSLRLILRRVRYRPFVFEHLAEITAIDPASAGRADEMLGFVLKGFPTSLPMYAPRGIMVSAATYTPAPAKGSRLLRASRRK